MKKFKFDIEFSTVLSRTNVSIHAMGESVHNALKQAEQHFLFIVKSSLQKVHTIKHSEVN